MSTTKNSPPTASAPTVPHHRPTPPVKLWAGVGAALLALQIYVLFRWLTGPQFHSVDPGPSVPPTWMSICLVVWQVIPIPLALATVWWFVVRPWRRDGHVPFDGVLVLGSATAWFWDSCSNAGNHWLVYNAEMFNRGNWAVELPWWSAFGEPGANTAMPLLFTPPAYLFLLLGGTLFGYHAMRRANQLWPRLTTAGLLGCAFVACCLFDLIVEGLIWMPMGIFEYPGGKGWALFGSTFHKFPLNEMVCWGVMFTAFASLKYFTNDRGQSLVERGIERVHGSELKKLALRVLAVGAMCQIIVIGAYHLPNTFIGLQSEHWPADLQKRSYFLGNVCGGSTGRACPAPGVANIRRDPSYLDVNGRPVIRPNAPAPVVIPLDIGRPGGEQ